MTSKKLLLPLFNTRKFLFFSFILSIIPLTQALSFKYPTALTLKNNKIFVIHSLGIDICDSLYKTSINIVQFEEELIQSDLPKISISKYETGEFIVLIIDTIYIFDGYGQKISNAKLTESFNAEYYTLSAHKIIQKTENNFYYFLLGYIDKSSPKLNLYYYSLDTNSKSIQTVSQKINYENNMKNSGVSCQFSLYDSDKYIFCIYETHRSVVWLGWDNDIFITYFQINQGSMEVIRNLEFEKLNFIYIQSILKSIDSKKFFCGINANAESICLFYDLIDGIQNSDKLVVDDSNQNNCISSPYNVKTYYFPETDEYVFSCLTVNNGIQTTIYNGNIAQISDIKNPLVRL